MNINLGSGSNADTIGSGWEKGRLIDAGHVLDAQGRAVDGGDQLQEHGLDERLAILHHATAQVCLII